MKKINIIITIAIALSFLSIFSSFSQTVKLKVLCWNIKAFEGDGTRPETQFVIENYVNIIKRHNPDIIGIQELETHTSRQGSRELMTELASRLGMYPVFGFSYIADLGSDGLYGNGILSKYPIMNYLSEPLRWVSWQSDPRSHQAAEILIPTPDGEGVLIRIVNVHFDNNGSQEQASRNLYNSVISKSDMPTLLMGDLNDNHMGSMWHQTIKRNYDPMNLRYNLETEYWDQQPEYTWAEKNKLDWILGYPKGVWKRVSYFVDKNYDKLSDHDLIIAEVEFPKK